MQIALQESLSAESDTEFDFLQEKSWPKFSNFFVVMRKNKRSRTDSLFMNSSFVMDVGSVLNLAGNHFPMSRSKSGFDVYFQTIASDWGMIGQDFEDVMKRMDQMEFGKEETGFKGGEG